MSSHHTTECYYHRKLTGQVISHHHKATRIVRLRESTRRRNIQDSCRVQTEGISYIEQRQSKVIKLKIFHWWVLSRELE